MRRPTARRLRAEPLTAQATLIAITGYGQQHDREAALAAGFAHHLVKPVDFERLLELLDGVRLAGGVVNHAGQPVTSG